MVIIILISLEIICHCGCPNHLPSPSHFDSSVLSQYRIPERHIPTKGDQLVLVCLGQALKVLCLENPPVLG